MKKDNRLTRNDWLPMSADDQKNLRAELEMRGVLAEFHDTATPLESSIVDTASCLYEFFHSNGYIILRSEWIEKTIVPALSNYEGWVYAFYGDDDSPIYVGETSRTFMERFTEHKKKQPWWSCWKRVKVLPCPNQSMRKVFESLIGLAGGYVANKMQPAGGDNIFDEVILSLLLLGNDDGTLPTFPNKMISDQAKLHLEQLPSELK